MRGVTCTRSCHRPPHRQAALCSPGTHTAHLHPTTHIPSGQWSRARSLCTTNKSRSTLSTTHLTGSAPAGRHARHGDVGSRETQPSTPPCTMYRHFRQARTSRSCAPCTAARPAHTWRSSGASCSRRFFPRSREHPHHALGARNPAALLTVRVAQTHRPLLRG